MADATKTATPTATPSNGKASRNAAPSFAGEVEDFPTANRDGFWQKQFNEVWSKNPGKVFKYENCSTTATTTIKTNFGADAKSKGAYETPDGKNVTTVYVRYDPERVEEVKADVRRRGESRRKAHAAKKAAEGSKSK